MFRSKKDVDAHVRDVFGKCTSENDRLKLCFGIAKQYAGIKEFDSARRYLDTYLASTPHNLAEAKKLMGDILLELGECERALENYQASYSDGKGRDALNRVCDLLTRGYGNQETAESKKRWFDLQKSSMNSTSFTASISGSPVVSRRQPQSTGGGPPRTGFGHSPLVNGSSSSLVLSSNKSNGGNVDLQLRYVERRFDDGLGKILDQNTLMLEQMSKFKEEMKDLNQKVEQIATTQQNLQYELKEITQKVDHCSEFKREMDRLADLITKMDASSHKEKISQVKTDTMKEKSSLDVKPLSTMFKKAEGSWDCTICYVNNGKDATVCLACNTCRPGFENTVKTGSIEAAPTTKPMFSFGFPAGTAQSQSEAPVFGITTPSNPIPNNPITQPPAGAPASTTVVDSAVTGKVEENKDTPFANLNLSGKFSFADLAKNNNSSFADLGKNNNSSFADLGKNNTSTFSFGTATGLTSFSGAGTPLFANTVTPTKFPVDTTVRRDDASNTSAHAEEGEDDFVPTAEFQPVIPLPPLVEVKKGDEDENTIAEFRAKLYRFLSESKEWKERGVGNIKLLQAKDDPKKCRVVMWREKIGKLACNFNLYADIKVTNYQGNAKVLCWKCQDHAEEPQWETFTCRFSSEEHCSAFKLEMERLADVIRNTDASTPNEKVSQVKTDTMKEKSSLDVKPLSTMFKKAEGSWDCAICYVNNGKDATVCLACNTCRPGFENTIKTESVEAAPTTKPMFSFGFPPAMTQSPSEAPVFGITTPSTTILNNPIIQPPASTTVVDSAVTAKVEENNDAPFANLNLSGKFSFADLAKNNASSFNFGTATGLTSFSGAGTPLFANAVTPTKFPVDTTLRRADVSNASAHAEEGEDDFVPTAEFQPVIPLPPLVEVKKGDEDENTIVEFRAKLYRFLSESKEWKERGVGNIKLLQAKDDPKKCRVVMWREKIGKLACNFNLYADIKVTNYQGNAKVLCWKCQDHAEEPQWETFTCRFSSEDHCSAFKLEMERLADVIRNTDASTPNEKVSQVKTDTIKEKSSLDVKPLSAMFKKAEGSWDCAICYVNNGQNATACLACNTCRPGFENTIKTESVEAAPTTKPMFSFGFPSAMTQSPSEAPVFGITTPSNTILNNPITQPPAGAQASTTVVDSEGTANVEESNDAPFANLNLSGKFSFADLAKNNNSSFADLAKTNTSSFNFGTATGLTAFSGAGTPLFANTVTPTKFPVDTTVRRDVVSNTSANAEEGEDDFVPTAEFQPVIPLPPLVEVKKGDEDENTIAEFRAKLYRFLSESKEWKERGVGNIKLLQAKDDPKKCRVVMWREKIGKLACNFNLYADIKVTNYQGNAKVLCWKCQDHAEEPQWETFTCRFSSEDHCSAFKREMERLADVIRNTDASTPNEKVSQVKTDTMKEKSSLDVKPLSMMFKKAEGSWDCAICYVNNGKDATACLACNTCRPGFENTIKTESVEAAPTTKPMFSFGFSPATAQSPSEAPVFGITTPSTTIPSNPITQPPASTTVVDSAVTAKVEENKDASFANLNLSGKFSFADLGKNNNSSFGFSTGTGESASSPRPFAASSCFSNEDENSTSCSGCIGCNPDDFAFAVVEPVTEEQLIDVGLTSDSSLDAATSVSLAMFEPSNSNGVVVPQSLNTTGDVKHVPDSSGDVSNNSLSSFSFSLQSPENTKSNPISSQFISPNFSFKPSEGSTAIFGGSMFGSPLNNSGSTSHFVSPFSQPQPLSVSNYSASQSVPSFISSPNSSNHHEPSTEPDNEVGNDRRDEDDQYEDVDDEEDECMFEDDAHVFIQDDADSSEGLIDKGEGVVRVLYDGESYCARLVIVVDGETVAEHLVAAETVLEHSEDLTYEWIGICNYAAPVKSRIRVKFSNDDAYQSFSTVMADSLEFAEQAGVTEAVLLEETSGY